MTNLYRRGRDFEHAVRAQLRADGYEVIRSAGSKSKVDLIALKDRHQLFVQCKIAGGTIPPAERAELIRLAAIVDALPIVAHKQLGVLTFRLLNGPGAKQWEPWTPDEVAS